MHTCRKANALEKGEVIDRLIKFPAKEKEHDNKIKREDRPKPCKSMLSKIIHSKV